MAVDASATTAVEASSLDRELAGRLTPAPSIGDPNVRAKGQPSVNLHWLRSPEAGVLLGRRNPRELRKHAAE